ncbi:hypothetical protein [Nocardia crassostreae]|uniref:hypothetical protein n=1 Tax=Nocardia crassostreae TaxID=53428 RepID=UPI000A88A514|nr:hypothetical protein [Nocardia crassostreae]
MNHRETQHLRPGSGDLPAPAEPFRLSVPSTAIAVGSLGWGIAAGGMVFLNRSPEPPTHVAGTAAWGPHLVLLVLAVAIGWRIFRRAPSPTRLLLAPLGAPAAKRLAHTALSIFRHPTALLRSLLAIPFLALLAYCPWRIGLQILAGLDPNFTVNAWGGPTYFGAMACHYLDGALLAAAAAAVLHRVLLPSPDSRP